MGKIEVEGVYIFIGQNENEGHSTTSFILELLDNEMSDRISINENGEVFIKVDKILAVSKESLNRFRQARRSQLVSSSETADAYEEQEIRCRSCRFYYIPRPGYRACPRCGTIN